MPKQKKVIGDPQALIDARRVVRAAFADISISSLENSRVARLRRQVNLLRNAIADLIREIDAAGQSIWEDGKEPAPAIGAALVPGPQIVHAVFDTPSFRFDAYGYSRRQCLVLLRGAWFEHCAQTGADPKYFDDTGINYITADIGSVWRDGDRLSQRKEG